MSPPRCRHFLVQKWVNVRPGKAMFTCSFGVAEKFGGIDKLVASVPLGTGLVAANTWQSPAARVRSGGSKTPCLSLPFLFLQEGMGCLHPRFLGNPCVFCLSPARLAIIAVNQRWVEVYLLGGRRELVQGSRSQLPGMDKFYKSGNGNPTWWTFVADALNGVCGRT